MDDVWSRCLLGLLVIRRLYHIPTPGVVQAVCFAHAAPTFAPLLRTDARGWEVGGPGVHKTHPMFSTENQVIADYIGYWLRTVPLPVPARAGRIVKYCTCSFPPTSSAVWTWSPKGRHFRFAVALTVSIIAIYPDTKCLLLYCRKTIRVPKWRTT